MTRWTMFFELTNPHGASSNVMVQRKNGEENAHQISSPEGKKGRVGVCGCDDEICTATDMYRTA